MPTVDLVRQMCRRSGIVDIAEVIPRTGGELSGVFEVRSGGVEPAGRIVKVYAEQWAWKQDKEVHVYELLEPAVGWATPTVLDVQTADNPSGLAYTVMTLLRGQPLSEVVPRLDRAAVSRLYRQIGSMAADLHQVRQPAFGYVVTDILEPQPDNTTYMTRQFDKTLREFVDAGGERGLIEQVASRLEAALSSLAGCSQAVLCHNDLHEGNLLVTDVDGEWRLTGLIDVENAVAADPLLDLAKTHCYAIRGDNVKARALAAGYGLPLEQGQERLDLYRIYHTLELWTWFQTIGRQEPLAGLTSQLHELLGGGHASD